MSSTLADRHRKQIAGLGGFEEPLIDEARAVGTQLRELSAGPPRSAAPLDDVQPLELRNRLGALLYDRMRRVRSAARFVFRHQPEVVRQVTSAYARWQRAAHRSRQAGGTEGAARVRQRSYAPMSQTRVPSPSPSRGRVTPR